MFQIVNQKNGLTIVLNKENYTAEIGRSSTAHGDILIPYSIFHESQEYVVTSIKEGSFNNNMQINEIHLPGNSKIQTIGANAFASSSIYSINLPPSIEILGEGWYKFTWRLKQIIIPPETKNFSYLDSSKNVIIGKNDKKSDIFDVLVFASRNIESITIPSAIRTISSFAFSSCSNLKKVDFQCNSNLNTIEKEAFSWVPIESITLPSQLRIIGDYSFHRCDKLQTVNFERSSELISIGEEAFSYTSINRFYITSHVTSIGKGAFSKGAEMEIEIDPLSEMETVNEKAFTMSSIKKIVIPATVKKIESSAFANCRHLTDVEFSESSELDEIKSLAFVRTSIKNFLFPKKVTKVSDCAFSNCIQLISVEFLGNDLFIGNKCFEYCLSLQLISLPNASFLSFEQGAFFDYAYDLSLFIYPRALITKI